MIPGELLKTCELLLRYATENHNNFNNIEGNEKERRNTHTLTQNLESIYKEADLKLTNKAPIAKDQRKLLQSTTEKIPLWGNFGGNKLYQEISKVENFFEERRIC